MAEKERKKGLWFAKWLCVFTAMLFFCSSLLCTVDARVVGVEITERIPFADGKVFGETGQYERIKGKLHYAVDVDNPNNSQIVDLKLAPRNDKGQVEFSGDFILLKPVDLSKGNHRLFYDVSNRGNWRALAYYNDASLVNDPLTAEDAGNGYLMREGYSILLSAWNWDVVPGSNRMQIELPIATDNGKTITELINAELDVLNKPGVKFQKFTWGNSRCYEVVDPLDNSTATLSVRDTPTGVRTEIPRNKWQFGIIKDGKIAPDTTNVYYEDGFQPGRIYELLYIAKDPRVVGLGLAAIRDAISFFYFETEDSSGNKNPLAVEDSNDKLTPDSKYSYIWGQSQSGRVITHMIWQGFHIDEKDRMVFDGARPHVSGGGKGGFNFRFAQTSNHPSHLETHYFPADFFPFNYNPQIDPVNGQTGDVLAKAIQAGKIPKIIVTNHESEYWTRAASLIHTDVTGTVDAMPHENVRMYLVNGANHNPGINTTRTNNDWEHSRTTVNARTVGRALLKALDNWVSQNVEPPLPAVPQIKYGELISVAQHKRFFPAIPGARHTGIVFQPLRLDYGPRFWTEGIQDNVPPKYFGPDYNTLLPNYDSDGNSIGGIRLPEIAAPLGTYQGFNPRRAAIGNPNYTARFDGSFWMFPQTEKERLEKGDPRLSIQARYHDKEAYVQQVVAAVEKLQSQCYLLKEDGDNYIRNAKNMVWPPVLIETYPYFKMEKDK